MSRPELLPLAVVAVITAVASATDLWKFKVYNVLTLPALVLGPLAWLALGGWSGLGSSLLGAGLGFATLAVFFAMGGVGAGDVKLLAAVGAWLGPFLTYQVFVASALAAGVYAVALVLLARGGVLGLFAEVATLGRGGRPEGGVAQEVKRPDRRRRLVPFAAMTGVGYVATLAWWHADLGAVWPPHDPDRTRAVVAAPGPVLEIGAAR